MRRDWEPEELIAAWTLLEGDWELVGNKRGATRLGFGVLLKFFELEGRFPRHSGEVPKAAVDYVAGQVKVDPALFTEYRWSGSTIEYHRAQVREALEFRESTRADEEVLAEWLATKICPMVFTDQGLRSAGSRLAGEDDRRRQARTFAAVLVQRQPVRHHRHRHGSPS
ncbi:protein of unknown function [Microbispora rosea]|uniref:DUF4158 domain-containing protein n=1 Tax=Microbispora rosea TaxID=58117 RepID=A0A1N6XV45_9ACTN|nr:DUF4158 domain-containing protein [Microbispora rosea]GIH51113.1 hypothetical protein Mro03_62920 [Microbispora rosea subsp. rosea]SIR06258.1 protein of unknown function [Microbispora rosea]